MKRRRWDSKTKTKIVLEGLTSMSEHHKMIDYLSNKEYSY
jgi:hypothetical protein